MPPAVHTFRTMLATNRFHNIVDSPYGDEFIDEIMQYFPNCNSDKTEIFWSGHLNNKHEPPPPPTTKKLWIGDREDLTIERTGYHLFSFVSDRFTNIVIADGVKTINKYAINSFVSLTHIELPDSLTQLEYRFLFGCHNLVSIKFPHSLTYMNNSCMNCCSRLEHVELSPNAIIGGDFMVACKSLKKLHIPEGVEHIGYRFLQQCINFEEIVLPESLQNIDSEFLIGVNRLETIRIPKGMRKISDNFLFGCSSIRVVIIEEGLEQIGNNFLRRCTNLEKVILPESLIRVGQSFLKECGKFRKPNMPLGLDRRMPDGSLVSSTRYDKIFYHKFTDKKLIYI